MSVGLPFPEILAAAQAGAGWARSRLYESTAPAVAGYVRAQGIADPADVTSDVFVAVLTGLPSFRGDEAHFRRWVFTIAYRRVTDVWRARSRPGPVVPAASVPSAEDVALDRLSGERAAELLARLTPEQRQVVALRVIADLSLEDVAHLLGKPVGAVKALQHRAIATLRRHLVGEAVSP
ncbi:MAG: RNA polymerase sigma factor [Acidimicrobiales bacterium]